MRKVISSLLTLAMIISMIPAVFANGETLVKEEYNLVADSGDPAITSSYVALAISQTKFDSFSDEQKKCYYEHTIEGNDEKYYLHKNYHQSYGTRKWRLLITNNETIIKAADHTRKVYRLGDSILQVYPQSEQSSYTGGVPSLDVAFVLQAPATSAFYIPTLSFASSSNSRPKDYYIDTLDEGKEKVSDYTKTENKVDRNNTSGQFNKVVYTASGNEIVIAAHTAEPSSGLDVRFSKITLTPLLGANMTASVENRSLDLLENTTTTASVKVSGTTDGTDATAVEMPVANGFVTYTVTEETDVIDVAADGTVTAKGAGAATITATVGELSATATITVTAPAAEPEEPGEEVTDTTVSVVVQSENTEEGTVSWNGETVDEVNMGDTVSATATANEGYAFRYWKNAIGQVLSEKAEESFIINTNSAITAVFDKVDDAAETVSVELYNANGMPFANKTVNKGTTFADAIKDVETPTYTGFGSFKHWSMYADESKIDDNMLIKQNTRAVAIFNEPTEKYTVSVNGTPVYSDVLYGTEVTVSSTASDFSYWKLGEKIVSYDKDFKFTVWGDVNLTEVKEGNVTAAPVATLTTVGSNPLLIYSVPTGYTVVEAGILFGSTADITISSVDGGRAAAARGTGQFTAQPKAGTTPAYSRGYLIFKNASGEIRILYAN